MAEVELVKYKVHVEEIVENEKGTLSWQPMEVEIDAGEDTLIDENAVDKELQKMGNLLAYYGDIAAKLKAQFIRKEEQLDAVISAVDDQLRQAIVAEGDKPSEARLKKAVIKHPEYQKTVDILGVYRLYYYRVEGLVRALRAKADALNTLAHNQRLEKKQYS